jgi:D-aspartate ligase
MPPTPLAYLIGDLDMLRPIAAAGIGCVVVARAGSAIARSRFVSGVIPWADPWEEPERLLMRLLTAGAREAEPPILFYQGDWDLLLVSRFRDRLAEVFRFVVPDATLVEDLVDKSRFRALAHRLGLPVPKTLELDDVDAIGDRGIRFPVIVKPLTRQARTWQPVAGDAKAVEARGLEELRALVEVMAGQRISAVAQEQIPGPESSIESYHVYIGSDGQVVGEFTGRKIRTLPPTYGHSSAVETTDSPDVMVLGRELVARMGLRGVAKLDFKRAPDGTLYLLEVNPRFNLWHHVGARAGVNLPALVHADLAGLPRPVTRRARPGVRWSDPELDVQAARATGMPLIRWLGWFLRCEAKSGVAWNDPLPALSAAWQRVSGSRDRTSASAIGPRAPREP